MTENMTLLRDGYRLSDITDQSINKDSPPYLSNDSWVYNRFGLKPQDGRQLEQEFEFIKNRMDSVDKFYPRYSNGGSPPREVTLNGTLTNAVPIMSMFGKGTGSNPYTLGIKDYTVTNGRPRYHTAERLGSQVREVFNIAYEDLSIKHFVDSGDITYEQKGTGLFQKFSSSTGMIAPVFPSNGKEYIGTTVLDWNSEDFFSNNIVQNIEFQVQQIIKPFPGEDGDYERIGDSASVACGFNITYFKEYINFEVDARTGVKRELEWKIQKQNSNHYITINSPNSHVHMHNPIKEEGRVIGFGIVIICEDVTATIGDSDITPSLLNTWSPSS